MLGSATSYSLLLGVCCCLVLFMLRRALPTKNRIFGVSPSFPHLDFQRVLGALRSQGKSSEELLRLAWWGVGKCLPF